MMATDTKIDFSKLLTIQEAAPELELARSTVQSMVSRNLIDTVETRLGRLIPSEAVTEYMRERRGKVGPKKKLRHST